MELMFQANDWSFMVSLRFESLYKTASYLFFVISICAERNDTYVYTR